MKNKKILQVTVMALLLAMFVSANAKTIKIATLSPDGTLWMKEMRAGAAEIRKKTDGRVVFKFYPGGVMGNDSNVLRKIRIGQLQGGAVTAGSMSAIDPDINIYGLPFLFSSLEQVDYVRKKMDKVLIKGLEKNGFVSFGFGEGGFTYMMSDVVLRSMDDVRHQKVWVPSGNQVGEVVFSSAEISPVSLPLSDVLTGLQTGLVNTVITSPIGALAFQWHTRISHVVDLPLTYVTAILVIDSKTFHKLKKEDQKTVREVMGAVFKRIDADNRKDNIAARAALKNQGIKFISLSKKSLAEWHVIGDKALRVLEKENNYSDVIYDQLKMNVEAAREIYP